MRGEKGRRPGRRRSHSSKPARQAARVAALTLAAALSAAPAAPPKDRAEADRLYDEVELAAAADSYAALVKATPEDPELRIRLAECLTRTDRFDEALEHARKAVELTNRGAAALAELGLALHRRGEFDAAEERLREATEADPDCARCWWGLARVEAIHGAYEEAAGHFQRAAALEPDDPIFLRHLASYVTDRARRKEIFARYLELPRREELTIWGNARTYLALLEYAGDRPLSQVDVPDEGTRVRLEKRSGMTYIPVDVGSRKNRRYLFDTGASGFTISKGLMKRLKLEPIDVFTITGIGGEGLADVTMVLVDEVRVGDAVVRNIPAVVRDAMPLVDGLMGPSFFGGVSVTLEHGTGWLRIGGDGVPGDEAAGAGKGRKGKKSGPARETVEIPFLSINATPFIPVQVDGMTMNAMVDTGGSQASLSRYAAGQVPGLELMAPSLTPQAYQEIRGSTGRSEDVRVVRRARLEFAGRTLEMAAHIPDRQRILVAQELTPLSHAFGTEVWAILGNPQLEEFDLTIDWGKQVLRMTPLE